MSVANVQYGKDDYSAMSAGRRVAFKDIAAKLGKNHPITKMMGSLAWGRHQAEQGPDSTLRTAIAEFGFLNGYFDCLNLWARDNDGAAQRVMVELWPSGMALATPMKAAPACSNGVPIK